MIGFNKINCKLQNMERGIPVGIFGGDCQVDFAEIYDYVKFLYEE